MQDEFIYDFRGEDASDGICITTETLYMPGQAGFVTDKNRAEQEGLSITEACGNFQPWYWLDGVSLGILTQTPSGITLTARETHPENEGRGLPMIFKADLPKNGNYSVNVMLVSPITQELSVFVGRRHLAFLGRVTAGQCLTLNGLSAVRPFIPRGKNGQICDKPSLEVSVMGKMPTLARIEIRYTESSTIWIGGDSTVTDQSANYPYLPGTSYAGWGQMLGAYLTDRYAVSNHAESGLTTATFRSEGYWEIARPHIKPGDICLFQFGHNDQKLPELTADGGYRDNLTQYVREVRAAGADSVIITPLARNSWRGGTEYNDLLADYDKACIALGAELNVPVIGVHKYSMARVKRQGLETAKAYYYPHDFTHTNDYGARLIASFIAGQLQRLFPDRIATSNSTHPPETPPHVSLGVPVPPQGWHGNAPAVASPFENIERPQDVLSRAEAMKFANDTVHIFATNVYNDHFEDVVGHEWYAGTIEAALDFGLVPKQWQKDNKIRPDAPVERYAFLEMLMLGLRVRRPWPKADAPQTLPAACEKCADALAAAEALGLCPWQGEELLKPIVRSEAAELCLKAEPMQ